MSTKSHIRFTFLLVLVNLLISGCIERESEELTDAPLIRRYEEVVDITHDEYDYDYEDNKQIVCDNNTQVLSNCANSCPASCEEPDKPACRRYCIRDCECKPGFVRDWKEDISNWVCIAIELCSKCGPNEHFRDCGPQCEATCTNYQNTPPHCNRQTSCKRGCICNFGFVRDMSKNGLCVRTEDCPQKCGPNEYFEESGPPCVRTARNPRPKCLDEPPVPTCVCNTGFIKNPRTGMCQKLSGFGERCDQNETFSYCGSECGRRCFDKIKKHFCPTICLRGCFCNKGYVRDSFNEKCVLPKDCYVWRP